VIALKYALLVSQWSYGHFLKLTDSILSEQHDKSSSFNRTYYVVLYPQNGDRIVTIDSVTSFHPVYIKTGGIWVAGAPCTGGLVASGSWCVGGLVVMCVGRWCGFLSWSVWWLILTTLQHSPLPAWTRSVSMSVCLLSLCVCVWASVCVACLLLSASAPPPPAFCALCCFSLFVERWRSCLLDMRG